MITACNHCGKKYEVPDKMLGRGANCPACGKKFLIANAVRAAEPDEAFLPPEPAGSTAIMQPPVSDEEAQRDEDPMAALADAAQSGSDMRPIRRGGGTRADTDEVRPARRRQARGAGLAMGMGITSLVLAVAAGALALVAMLSKGQDTIVALGVIALVLAACAAIGSLIAVVNGNTASRAIRRARHPLSGRGQASAGTILGAVAIGIVAVTVTAGAVWLGKRGGLVFEETITNSPQD